MKPRHLLAALLATVTTLTAAGPLVLPLWPDAAPAATPEQVRVTAQGEHVVSHIRQPSLTVYLPAPEAATGAAVVVCPGGGHRELWMDHEGYAVAEWLAAHGIAAAVLKYRLAREPGSTYRVEVESLADARRALRMMRARAAEWRLDPARVGIMGFSAGGELAALAAAAPADHAATAPDPLERLDARPAFQALIYPGNTKAIVPTKEAPPAFLLCGADDRPDIARGLAEVYLRFQLAGAPAELHIYAGIGHGFGLRASNARLPVAAWPERLREWLAGRGFLGATP